MGVAMALDPKDVGELQKAVNDAAGKASILWTAFVTFALYIVISFGSVTHRDLFLQTPIKLPALNVDLPLVGFFVVAPTVLVILHFYVFLQLLGLAAKSRAYDLLLKQEVPIASEQQYARQCLDSFVVLQLLAGPKVLRTGFGGVSLVLIAWITLICVPVLVLLQGQIIFLPYHSEWVVWSQRLLLVLDLAVIWYFWTRVRVERDATVSSVLNIIGLAAGAAMSLIVVIFSTFLATFPSEFIYQYTPRVPLITVSDPIDFSIQRKSLHELLFAGAPDEVTGRTRSLFSNRLVLTDQSVINDPSKLGQIEISYSFRGRDLREAVLNRADLRKADFTGALLESAILDSAKLQNAQLGCESNGPAVLDFACVSLHKAVLRGAQLQGANLNGADLQGAILFLTQFQGASLSSARLRGAYLYAAQLQGADLNHAQLQGANLSMAQLQAASLYEAELEGADLSGAQLQGADLTGARLQGADLHGTQMQGASLQRASVWRTNGTPTIDYAALNNINARALDKFTPVWREDILKVVAAYQLNPRGMVEKRLSALDPDTKDGDLIDLTNTQVWRRASPTPAQSGTFLADFACRRNSAPYIARRLVHNEIVRSFNLSQDEAIRLRDEMAIIGSRLWAGKSDQSACPGVAGFADKDWEYLDAVIERLDAIVAQFGNGAK
jgi:uncharacterized protein YjbI with pentapeptide repeats